MEVVCELCLEREASVKREKGQVFQEWISKHGNGDSSIPFRDVVCVGHGG